LLGLVFGLTWASAASAVEVDAAGHLTGQPAATAAAASNRAAPNAPSRPPWRELSPQQQAALKPIESEWPRLSAQQKRKWLEVAARYETLDPSERARLQERMSAWTRMSPEQRRHARLNFQTASGLDAQARAAKWREYQQLPAEKRAELARRAELPKGAARSARTPQANAGAGVRVPKAAAEAAGGKATAATPPVGGKRIETSPALVDPQTLMPTKKAEAGSDKARAAAAARAHAAPPKPAGGHGGGAAAQSAANAKAVKPVAKSREKAGDKSHDKKAGDKAREAGRPAQAHSAPSQAAAVGGG
jgi:hypothetical protein